MLWTVSWLSRLIALRTAVPPELQAFPQGKTHDLHIDRRFSPLTAAVVGGDLFDAETEIVGFHDDLGQNKKRLGSQIDPVEDLSAPGLRPIVVVDADLEEIVQREDIDYGKKKPEKLVGVPLPAYSQKHIGFSFAEDLHEIRDL